MTSAILKWLAAGAVGAAVAALQTLLQLLGAGPVGVDPLISGILVAAVTKLVNYLIGKLSVSA